MTSKQKCTEHAQATLPRLERKHLGSSQVRYATPTLGDWLELLGEHPKWFNVGMTAEGVVFGDTNDSANWEKFSLTFNLATNEPDNWDTLASLLGLDNDMTKEELEAEGDWNEPEKPFEIEMQ